MYLRSPSHEELISPERIRGPRLPPLIILVPSPKDFHVISKLHLIHTSRPSPVSLASCYPVTGSEGSLGVAGPAVGAPAAVMLAENLFARGCQKLLLLGSCGSLAPDLPVGSLFLPSESWSDEGTSRHYFPGIRLFFADLHLHESLDKSCRELGISAHRGRICTTDAPYRETREVIARYRKRGGLGVDMETSALFALGAFRSRAVAALQVVSDELRGEGWAPGFRTAIYRQGKERALQVIFRTAVKLPRTAKMPEGTCLRWQESQGSEGY